MRTRKRANSGSSGWEYERALRRDKPGRYGGAEPGWGPVATLACATLSSLTNIADLPSPVCWTGMLDIRPHHLSPNHDGA